MGGVRVEMGMVWVWALGVVLWLPTLTTAATSTTYNTLVGQKMVMGTLEETPIPSRCKCRARCWTRPACLAWSSFVSSGDQLICRLADSGPTPSDMEVDQTAITGTDLSIPVPITTTTTTTTITTTTTTTPIVITYERKVEKHNGCDDKHGVTAIILKTGETIKRNNIEYLECTKPSSTAASNIFDAERGSKELMSMGPSPSSEPCSPNNVIMNIKAYKTKQGPDEYSDEDSLWDNTEYMLAVCSPLQHWVLDSGDCETVLLQNNEDWPGQEYTSESSSDWNVWVKCSEQYMAVQVTRVPGMNDNYRKLWTMKCCRVNPN